jgi:hypothetical protein
MMRLCHIVLTVEYGPLCSSPGWDFDNNPGTSGTDLTDADAASLNFLF